ncbi:MAG TPA: hypothetical protein VL943_08830 [Niabella sp.]|nr:hypothetical protein [Cellvibrio sp.]HTG56358.1 hypothetical protein [Niabella sp.]
MNVYFYAALIVQKCIAEKFDIPVQDVNFDKRLESNPPTGYGFNENSLMAFVQIDIKNRIHQKYPTKTIVINPAEAKVLTKGSSVPLVAFIAQQL